MSPLCTLYFVVMKIKICDHQEKVLDCLISHGILSDHLHDLATKFLAIDVLIQWSMISHASSHSIRDKTSDN